MYRKLLSKKKGKVMAGAFSIMLFILSATPAHGEVQTAEIKNEVPGISAQAAILMELSTGRVLYEKNKNLKAYPASTTKIMTALLAIENADMDERIEIPQKAVGIEGSSIYLESGETVILRDLLFGLMLQSGNDAAMAIAEKLGAGVEDFVSMMNQRAKTIGASETNFVNPSGLYDDNHYTTVYDMALIAREAMQNPEFRKIAAARSWQSQRGPGKYSFFSNKNKVVFDYNGGSGIKIGYTKKSGRTLVASSERDNLELICVVMNAPDWFKDSYKLMDYGHANFKTIKILEGGKALKAQVLFSGEKNHVFLGLKEDLTCPIKRKEDETSIGDVVTLRYENDPKASAPVARWQEAGMLAVYLNGELLYKKPMYYLEDIGVKMEKSPGKH